MTDSKGMRRWRSHATLVDKDAHEFSPPLSKREAKDNFADYFSNLGSAVMTQIPALEVEQESPRLPFKSPKRLSSHGHHGHSPYHTGHHIYGQHLSTPEVPRTMRKTNSEPSLKMRHVMGTPLQRTKFVPSPSHTYQSPSPHQYSRYNNQQQPGQFIGYAIYKTPGASPHIDNPNHHLVEKHTSFGHGSVVSPYPNVPGRVPQRTRAGAPRHIADQWDEDAAIADTAETLAALSMVSHHMRRGYALGPHDESDEYNTRSLNDSEIDSAAALLSLSRGEKGW